ASYLSYYNVELRTEADADLWELRHKHRGQIPSLVQLLGSAGWHHPWLTTHGGVSVLGALVVDVFAGTDDGEIGEAAEEFAVRFLASTGRPPSTAAAEAHDAALLLLAARRRALATAAPNGVLLRPQVARSLLATSLGQGACGPARITPNGEIARGFVLLRLEKHGFVLQDPFDE
ncbi:MAG: hypothetical protein V2A73_05660, partial [Pseudomonadota bacterium]